jgi:hypothetical protein
VFTIIARTPTHSDWRPAIDLHDLFLVGELSKTATGR